MTAIILAGGFGTRLQSVVKDVPKPMADINGKPFLAYLLQKLSQENISKIILCVGYKKETIMNYFGSFYLDMEIIYSQEKVPLGTGGAIKKALIQCNKETEVLVFNGDSFFNLDIKKFINKFKNNELTIALKPMKNFDRYGSVKVEGSLITTFYKKKFVKNGLINAGVYIISTNFIKKMFQDTFSFEEFLENEKELSYYIENSYFVDIGIPQDYAQAQIDFKELF